MKEEKACGIQYASLQKKAIKLALENGVMILTGGPGTGKTTVVRALLDIFSSMGLKIALAAPTGRAAKRLSESTLHEAKTIHRLLEMSYENDEEAVFNRDENNCLEENVIIVDEASMIDNSLMASLLKAVKPGARVIIIGDADQLPSVGAGNVLRDIISSERFATVCLTEIFRQAKQSLIVTNAHDINRGKYPNISTKDNDFFYLDRRTDKDIALTVADLWKNRLPKSYGSDTVNNIQVISPSKKGEAGTDNLNVLLQNCLNPSTKGKKEYKFRDKIFREGDRVMQVRNNYDLEWERSDGTGFGIFNGDIGVIEEINYAEQCMQIVFDERRTVYDFTILDELEHAYAITVHKSQGSEYPIVIIPMYSAPPMLLTRNLLYTAVTRAQRMVILVGRSEVIERMVDNDRQSMRYTGLAVRLKKYDEAMQ
jgi:exodeoxyribonuclease V alpha subunit